MLCFYIKPEPQGLPDVNQGKNRFIEANIESTPFYSTVNLYKFGLTVYKVKNYFGYLL